MHQIQLLKKYGLSVRGARSQHLLVDENIQRKLVSAVNPKAGETILEIGPGLGAITELLLKSGARVVAVEQDRRFVEILKGELETDFDHLKLVHGDILKISLDRFVSRGSHLKVVGNIPYYITSPILLYLIKHRRVVDSAYLMMQREIADRIFAQPGTKAYGRLSLLVRYYADVRRAFEISRHCFSPEPKVDSSFIELVFRRKLPESIDEDALFTLIKFGFATRRKRLLNALTDGFRGKVDKQKLKDILNEAGFSENVRAEELMLKDFMRLAVALRGQAFDLAE